MSAKLTKFGNLIKDLKNVVVEVTLFLVILLDCVGFITYVIHHVLGI